MRGGAAPVAMAWRESSRGAKRKSERSRAPAASRARSFGGAGLESKQNTGRCGYRVDHRDECRLVGLNGLLNPLIFLTNCSSRSRFTVTGGAKLKAI
jgi:hypothetical protein